MTDVGTTNSRRPPSSARFQSIDLPIVSGAQHNEGMPEPGSNDPYIVWRPILDAIRHVVTAENYQDTSAGAFSYAEWTWLDDPLPSDVEAAVLAVASANDWNLGQTRAQARKTYYGELRREFTDYLMLHAGVPPVFDLPPNPIASLPEQVSLSGPQLGYLHAQGQLAADHCDIRGDQEYRWQGVLDYGGWLVADPRHLEGPVAQLEQHLSNFVDAVVPQGSMAPAATPHFRGLVEEDARRALYHAYWYRLNVRSDRMSLARVEKLVADLKSQFRPGGPKPQPQPYGVSHQGAEQLCAEWLIHLGATNIAVTRASGDGGIDIIGDIVIAQVKNYVGTVGVEEIRAFHGVASVERRMPVFFTSGKYAAGAIDFADRAEMALLVYNAVEGTLHGANQRGSALILVGLSGDG